MKHYYLYTLLLQAVFTLSLKAQPALQWAANAGGPASESIHAIATDDSGNIYIAGRYNNVSTTFGNVTLYNRAPSPPFSTTIFLAKYNKQFNCLWAKNAAYCRYPAGGFWVNGLTVDKYGGICIAGAYAHDSIYFGNTTLPARYEDTAKVFIARYNNSGDFEWAHSAGTGSDDRVMSMANDRDGNVYVTGWYYSPQISFGPYTFTNRGARNIFIAKYNTAGQVLWAKSAGGTFADLPTRIVTSAQGDVYVAGVFSGDTLFIDSEAIANTSFANQGDMFVAQFTASGNLVRVKTGGGTGHEMIDGLAVDGQGNMYIAGRSRSIQLSFDGYTIDNSTYYTGNMFVIKYDSAGEVQWYKSNHIQGLIWLSGAVVDNAGNLYVVGNTPTPITFGSYSLGGNNIFLAKYYSTGVVANLWGVSLENVNNPNHLVTSSGDNIYVAGSYVKWLSIDSVTRTSRGGTDIFIAGVEGDAYTGIPVTDVNTATLLYPNPAGSMLHVSAGSPVSGYTLFNTMGQAVSSAGTGGRYFDVDISLLPPGVYFLKLHTTAPQGVIKFIKAGQ